MNYGFTTSWRLVACLALVSCGAETDSSAAPDSTAGAITQTSPPADGAGGETAVIEGAIDENVVALLKETTSKLASLSEFTVTMETGFDVLQPGGQKLEFGSWRAATIRRPDRARFSYKQRSGATGELIFDGADIWVYQHEENVYASIEQPGDIDTSVDIVTEELGIPVPASDFFAADPGAALAAGVLEARDLGPSTIDNQPGRHLGLRKLDVDYQIWISDATRLPMRVVITYREEPGQPQFWAQFRKWEIPPANPDTVFQFSPPEGSERIRFALFDTSDDTGEEAP